MRITPHRAAPIHIRVNGQGGWYNTTTVFELTAATPQPQTAVYRFRATEPGVDVAPIHNRQVVILERADWRAWLDLTHPEADLLRPLPAGSLILDQVR
jgi:putative SOS response-associated peptidase YedK